MPKRLVKTRDYNYIYEEELGGYRAESNCLLGENCGKLKKKIHGKPLKSLMGTFKYNWRLVKAPEIPDTVIDIDKTFIGGRSLRTYEGN